MFITFSYYQGRVILKQTIITVFIAVTASIAILHPYLLTRATISDSAVKERYFYNKIGEKIIANHLINGTGLGTSVLHMEQFAGQKLEPWEIQPIHNYYLISFAEWGIGAILLLTTIIYPLVQLWGNLIIRLKQRKECSIWNITIGIIMSSYLILFFLDHYFYTIWQTQLLLWLMVGFVMAANSNNKQQGLLLKMHSSAENKYFDSQGMLHMKQKNSHRRVFVITKRIYSNIGYNIQIICDILFQK